MTKQRRRKIDAALKAKIVLEAVREQRVNFIAPGLEEALLESLRTQGGF